MARHGDAAGCFGVIWFFLCLFVFPAVSYRGVRSIAEQVDPTYKQYEIDFAAFEEACRVRNQCKEAVNRIKVRVLPYGDCYHRLYHYRGRGSVRGLADAVDGGYSSCLVCRSYFGAAATIPSMPSKPDKPGLGIIWGGLGLLVFGLFAASPVPVVRYFLQA